MQSSSKMLEAMVPASKRWLRSGMVYQNVGALVEIYRHMETYRVPWMRGHSTLAFFLSARNGCKIQCVLDESSDSDMQSCTQDKIKSRRQSVSMFIGGSVSVHTRFELPSMCSTSPPSLLAVIRRFPFAV